MGGDIMMHSPLIRVRYELRCLLAVYPAIYLPLARLKRRGPLGAQPVTPGSDLVIEAFPRSGNTFATMAFSRSQPVPIKLAHHLHAPAQLIAAARWQRPALLIIRPPADAVGSFVQREPEISLNQALRNWQRFHAQLLSHLNAFVLATFEQVTDDFGHVIERINVRFGTDFLPFDHSARNVAACFRDIELRNAQRFGEGAVLEGGVARPSAERRAAKTQLLQQLQAPPLADRLAAADALYRRLAARAAQGDAETRSGRTNG